jgi:hypothetical protein
MDIPYRVCVAASIVLLASSCATRTTILPALDASKTTKAKALVVQADHVRGFNSPIKIVRGSGEGAKEGMRYYVRDIGGAGLWGTAIGILLAPILLPTAAVTGAALAHSKDEVDAAVNAFDRVGQDIELLTSIDRRFVEALDTDTTKQWACIEAVSMAIGEPCSGNTPTARLALRPNFGLMIKGAYDPDIFFYGSVVALVSMEQATPDTKLDAVVEAKWVYREELGEFFELAIDDATLLRNKLENILDRFAARIAEDLYMDPRSETLVNIPEGVVVRIEQGSDLLSIATHGVVQTTGISGYEHCWIKAVDGKATNFNSPLNSPLNFVPVKRGGVRVDVTCLTFSHQVDSVFGDWTKKKQEEFSIEVSVEPGAFYVTDGRTYKRRDPPTCTSGTRGSLSCIQLYW